MGSMFGAVVVLPVFIFIVLGLHGDILSLWSLEAFVMVIGGTFTAATLSYPLGIVLRAPRLIWEAYRPTKIELTASVALLVKITDRIRSAGINAAVAEARHLNDDFLKKGIQYLGEGFSSEEIRDLMEAEMVAIRQRHRLHVGLFESMGGYAPTMGILGTVSAMIKVLGNLQNPDQLGPSIAVAMVATLYGVASANLLFLPVGNKLKKLSEEELRIRWVMVEVILAIQAGANPRAVRERLRVSLPPSTRKMIAEMRRRPRRTASMAQEEMVEMQIPQGEGM